MKAGAKSFQRDLSELDWGQYEDLVHRLIQLDWPDAEKLDPPDGGADSIVASGADGHPRVFQAKHYGGRISAAHWAKCEESLDRSVREHSPRRVTFVFPRNLTHSQRKVFKSRLQHRHGSVHVDYWGLADLDRRLRASPAVAVEFFGEDAEDVVSKLLRAAQDGLRVSSIADLLGRERETVHFLDDRDAAFLHQHLSGDPSLPPPSWDPPPYVVVGTGTPAGPSTRIAAWPRPEVKAPRPGLSFLPGEAGTRAREKARAALAAGEEVELTEGVAIQMLAPQVLKDALAAMPDPRMEGLTLYPSPPVAVELNVKGPTRPLRLSGQVRPVPPRIGAPVGAAAYLGVVEGLHVELETVMSDDGLNWSATIGPPFGPGVREGLLGVAFLEHWAAVGRMELKLGKGLVLPINGGPANELEVLLAWRELFSALASIEEYADLAFSVPATLGRTEIEMVLVAARLVAGEVAEMILELSPVGGPSALPVGSGRTEAFGIEVLGEKIRFGPVEWSSGVGVRAPLAIEVAPVPALHLRLRALPPGVS